MSRPPRTSRPLQFKVSQVAVYGDSINNIDSVPAEFWFEHNVFTSMAPVSRGHAVELNEVVKKLEKQVLS